MVNQASNANHIPQRTCVICKKKTAQKNLIRFVILQNEIVFDLKRNLKAKGHYVCDANDCICKLERWRKRKIKNAKRKDS